MRYRSQRGLLTAALFAAYLGGTAPSAALPPQQQLVTLLAKIQSTGQRTSTLQASFVQRKRMPMFKSEVVTKGRLAYSRPDRLRWETLAPDAAVVVLRGERAELRLPGEAPRVMELRAGSALGSLVEQMLVWFGVRPASDLHKYYEVSLRGSSTEPQLHLVPKNPALRKRVASMDIWLGKDLAPKNLQLSGSEGEVTRIEFGAIQRNLRLPESLFR